MFQSNQCTCRFNADEVGKQIGVCWDDFYQGSKIRQDALNDIGYVPDQLALKRVYISHKVDFLNYYVGLSCNALQQSVEVSTYFTEAQKIKIIKDAKNLVEGKPFIVHPRKRSRSAREYSKRRRT